jgi:hypothetical protein
MQGQSDKYSGNTNAPKMKAELNECPYKRTDYLLKRSMRLHSEKVSSGPPKRRYIDNFVKIEDNPKSSYNGAADFNTLQNTTSPIVTIQNIEEMRITDNFSKYKTKK